MDYSIKNDYLTLTVSTFGAEPVSIVNKDGEEMLWAAEPSVWNRHAPILFPYTGKLSDGYFEYEGKQYKGGQHGFARDMEHRFVEETKDSLVFELSASEETRKRYPFDFTLRSTFKLAGKTVHHTLTVINNGESAMPFGIGYHPAFKLPFDDKHDTTDYEFCFDTMESPLCIDTNPNGLISGNCFYLASNVEKIDITDDLFDNGSYAMANLSSKTLSVVEKDSGKKITCNIEDFPYTLIWSSVNSPKLKFVCIEPWHSLPGIDGGSTKLLEKPSTKILNQGEEFVTTLSMKFER